MEENSSVMTEDATLYRTAVLRDSPPLAPPSHAASSSSSATYGTARDTLRTETG